MRQAGEPMDGVDLMAHPLAGDARGIGPEQPELEVFARIPRRLRPVHLEALPVGVLLADRGDQVGPPPAPGLVDVPGHLGGDDRAELAALEIVAGCLIGRPRPALRADLHDPLAGAHRLEGGPGVQHRFGKRLFAVDVAAGLDRLGGMQRAGEPVGKPHDADADALVGAGHAGLPQGGGKGAGGEQAEGSQGAGAKQLAAVHGWRVVVESRARRLMAGDRPRSTGPLRRQPRHSFKPAGRLPEGARPGAAWRGRTRPSGSCMRRVL